MLHMSYNFSVGIIGEPMEKFNPQTLSPKADNDEDESEGDDKKSEGRRGFCIFHIFYNINLCNTNTGGKCSRHYFC